MKNWLKWTLFSLWLCCVLSSLIYAQGMDQLHGDEAYAYRGISRVIRFACLFIMTVLSATGRM